MVCGEGGGQYLRRVQSFLGRIKIVRSSLLQSGVRCIVKLSDNEGETAICSKEVKMYRATLPLSFCLCKLVVTVDLLVQI